MKLVGLWLLLSALIALLTVVNPNHFVSIDSQYYLSMAGWLVGLDGDHYGHVSTGWDGTFPLGYPLLIGGLARLTGTSLLVASKVLNSLLIGGFLLIWQRRLGRTTALWMGSVLLLGGFLRVLTYTWSEWAFLVVLLEWYWLDSRRPPVPTYPHVLRLLLLTLLLFLLRYVGGFVVVAYGLRAGLNYVREGLAAHRWPTFRQGLGPDLLYGVLSVAFIVGYFVLNDRLTPSAYGGERFYSIGETVWDKLGILGIAFLNEGLLLRDYVPAEPVALVWLGLSVQAALLVWLWRIVYPRRETLIPPPAPLKSLFATWAWASATYLVIVFTMRFFSPFNGPNARMMSVVTLPLLLGMAWWTSRWPNLNRRRQVVRWWVVLLLASTLQLLPQADLMGKVGQFLNAKGTLRSQRFFRFEPYNSFALFAKP